MQTAVAMRTATSHPAKSIVITEEDYWSFPPAEQALEWLFHTYEKLHPNITFNRDIVPAASLGTKLEAQASTHTLPDLVVYNVTQGALFYSGALLNLRPLIARWGQWSSYIRAARVTGTVKGKIYGISVGTANLGIIYNKKLFAEAGITTLPKTWAQLEADGEQLIHKVKGLTYGAISFSGGVDGCSTWQFTPWMWDAGGSLADMDSAGTVAALTYWVNLVKTGLASKNVVSLCQSASQISELIAGKLAMVEDGPWSFPQLDASHFTDWGTFSIPVPKAGEPSKVPLGGEFWVVPKTTPSTEAAVWAFLKWSQMPAILNEFDTKLGYYSVRPALWPEEKKADPALTPFIDTTALSETHALGDKFGTYSVDIATAITQAILGEKSPSAALEAAEKAAIAGTS